MREGFAPGFFTYHVSRITPQQVFDYLKYTYLILTEIQPKVYGIGFPTLMGASQQSHSAAKPQIMSFRGTRNPPQGRLREQRWWGFLPMVEMT